MVTYPHLEEIKKVDPQDHNRSTPHPTTQKNLPYNTCIKEFILQSTRVIV
jgi:hypothetical protein